MEPNTCKRLALNKLPWKLGFLCSIFSTLTFQTSLEVTKRSHYITFCCFSGNDTRKWCFAIWVGDNSTQVVHEHSKFWKNFNVHWVRLWTTTNTPLWIFRVNKLFKKHFDTPFLRNLWNFANLLNYFIVSWPGGGTRK